MLVTPQVEIGLLAAPGRDEVRAGRAGGALIADRKGRISWTADNKGTKYKKSKRAGLPLERGREARLVQPSL